MGEGMVESMEGEGGRREGGGGREEWSGFAM